MHVLLTVIVVTFAFLCGANASAQTLEIENAEIDPENETLDHAANYGDAPGVGGRSLTQVQIDKFVTAHNDVRRAVGVIQDLRWAEDLAAHAQKWSVARSTACDLEHRQNDPLGENLFWASAVTRGDGTTAKQDITPTDVVGSWADEKADYHYDTNHCNEGRICGHYTQVVWMKTTEVGCGMSMCPDNGQVWVCNYRPAGNFNNEKPY